MMKLITTPSAYDDPNEEEMKQDIYKEQVKVQIPSTWDNKQ